MSTTVIQLYLFYTSSAKTNGGLTEELQPTTWLTDRHVVNTESVLLSSLALHCRSLSIQSYCLYCIVWWTTGVQYGARSNACSVRSENSCRGTPAKFFMMLSCFFLINHWRAFHCMTHPFTPSHSIKRLTIWWGWQRRLGWTFSQSTPKLNCLLSC